MKLFLFLQIIHTSFCDRHEPRRNVDFGSSFSGFGNGGSRPLMNNPVQTRPQTRPQRRPQPSTQGPSFQNLRRPSNPKVTESQEPKSPSFSIPEEKIKEMTGSFDIGSEGKECPPCNCRQSRARARGNGYNRRDSQHSQSKYI